MGLYIGKSVTGKNMMHLTSSTTQSLSSMQSDDRNEDTVIHTSAPFMELVHKERVYGEVLTDGCRWNMDPLLNDEYTDTLTLHGEDLNGEINICLVFVFNGGGIIPSMLISGVNSPNVALGQSEFKNDWAAELMPFFYIPGINTSYDNYSIDLRYFTDSESLTALNCTDVYMDVYKAKISTIGNGEAITIDGSGIKFENGRSIEEITYLAEASDSYVGEVYYPGGMKTIIVNPWVPTIPTRSIGLTNMSIEITTDDKSYLFSADGIYRSLGIVSTYYSILYNADSVLDDSGILYYSEDGTAGVLIPNSVYQHSMFIIRLNMYIDADRIEKYIFFIDPLIDNYFTDWWVAGTLIGYRADTRRFYVEDYAASHHAAYTVTEIG